MRSYKQQMHQQGATKIGIVRTINGVAEAPDCVPDALCLQLRNDVRLKLLLRRLIDYVLCGGLQLRRLLFRQRVAASDWACEDGTRRWMRGLTSGWTQRRQSA